MRTLLVQSLGGEMSSPMRAVSLFRRAQKSQPRPQGCVFKRRPCPCRLAQTDKVQTAQDKRHKGAVFANITGVDTKSLICRGGGAIPACLGVSLLNRSSLYSSSVICNDICPLRSGESEPLFTHRHTHKRAPRKKRKFHLPCVL